jgi:hypothetical protein
VLPGMAEAGTAVKAGSSILGALTKRSGQTAWPNNMHESLLALHAILSEWCGAACITNSAVKLEYAWRDARVRELDDERKREKLLTIRQSVEMEAYLRDIGELLEPRARLVERWSKKNRRAAARRGLRTLLDVYAPGLRVDIQSATQKRRKLLDGRLGDDAWGTLEKMSNEQLVQLDVQTEKTYEDLSNVTNTLALHIIKYFPLDPQSDAQDDRRGQPSRLGWSWGIQSEDTQAENRPP